MTAPGFFTVTSRLVLPPWLRSSLPSSRLSLTSAPAGFCERAVYDKYPDLRQALERQLVERPEPPSHVTARRQLEAAKVGVWPGAEGIIAVFPEAIIFRKPIGRVFTAWSDVKDDGRKVTFYVEAGMPALSPAEREHDGKLVYVEGD